jgi:hypothetical protein
MLKYSTPKGITFKQFEEVLSVPALKDYMYSKKRNKRLRYLYACLIYFDMKKGESYTTDELTHMAKKYSPTGPAALSLSSQSVGQHMGNLVRRGVLGFNKVNGLRHYYKVI